MLHRHCFLLAAALCSTSASGQTRHAEAHIHGTGQLLMVIDKAQVSLELAVPAADIVGFEREPADDAERASVDAASVTLAEPLTLFSFSPEAGCTIISSAAHFGQDHEVEPAEPHTHNEHVEFAASYLLDCPRLSDATLALETQFFTLFAAAEALLVQGLIDGVPIDAVLSRQQPSATLR